MWCADAERRDADRLALQVADRADAVGAEQLEAADVDAAEEHDRVAGVELDDERRDERHADVDLAGREGWVRGRRSIWTYCDLGEPLGREQIVGQVLRSDADAGESGRAGSGWSRAGHSREATRRTAASRWLGHRRPTRPRLHERRRLTDRPESRPSPLQELLAGDGYA